MAEALVLLRDVKYVRMEESVFQRGFFLGNSAVSFPIVYFVFLKNLVKVEC